MAFTRSLKCLTFDVTGTLVSFKGRLGDHYLQSAKRCGLRFKNENVAQLESGFDKAYDETHLEYPCFGAVHDVSAKDWWRRCIIRSFEIAREDAGADPDVPALDADQQERVFQHIYALFGSHATYGVFADVIPFLTWARRRKIVTGIISNADERYGDAILPMLDLSDHLDFTVFARDVGAMKPDQRIFDVTLQKANVAREVLYGADTAPIEFMDVLHVGNSFSKDFVGARDAGMRAVLLDRFGRDEPDEESSEGKEWRAAGAAVVHDLSDVLEHVARSDFALGCSA